MSLTLDKMIDIYEKCRPWYAGDGSDYPDASIKVSGLADIIDDFDLILLDSYGVLCRGPVVIPQALSAIKLIREKNKAFSVVSNDTMTTQFTAELKYEKLGFDFKYTEVVTSLDVVAHYMENHGNLKKLQATGMSRCPLGDVYKDVYDLTSTQGLPDEMGDELMFLVGAGWQEEWQQPLVQHAAQTSKVLVGNPDVGAPSGDVIVKTPGYWAHDFYEKSGYENSPVLLGKPAAVMFEHVLEKLDYKGDPERVLMVGDTLHTDILGGHSMGFKTLLVESGIFMETGAQKYIEKTGIVPTYIAPTL